ncbi:phosphoesterase PA-phosphatase [Micromonospora sp. DR5-3]|uniref:phosphoesterase PA-phosphatase n=1 Tax=unclassified Micromonospora TaxID=2617518 RepID=UPI0011D8C3AF|nr:MULTISPECIES: phosphoesterase PA-phosphatase [unclassified Micromonospora]MCW3816640.1 phosphoesterase PA-phosphatase [Micromonospora sp. DR5-3]TYC23016.1 phosphoesterase PA-phosphatase [Micromonospora sp. MP36]
MRAVAERTVGGRLARLITEVLAPSVLVTAMPLLVAAGASHDLGSFLRWAGTALLFCAVIPVGVIVHGVRRGRLTDRHVGDRTQRARPLLTGLASVAVGMGLLVALRAPAELFAMIVVIFVVGAACTLVNHWWKLSIHAAVAAASAAVLVLLHGPALHVGWLLVAAVAWSRVVLRDHTWPQVAAGTALGAPLAAGTFLALT